jgi:membrane-anchored mycosin MYCP
VPGLIHGAPGRHAVRGPAAALAAAAIVLAAAPPAGAATGHGAWYLDRFGMSVLWQHTQGSGIVVAEVGTGVDAADPDLAGQIEPEVGISGGASRPATGDSSATYDGTQVAALIAGTGQRGSGVQGLAPEARILPIQLIEATSASLTYDESVGIRYAVRHGARVVVIPAPLPGTSAATEAAVKYAVQNDVLVIASSGNHGDGAANPLTDPCAAPGAVCVNAVSQSGAAWPHGNTGGAVSLAAPGDQIPVPVPGGVATQSSTHFAAAITAGEAALVWSAHPTWTAGQVLRAMLENVTGGDATHTRVGPRTGYGVISPAAAVAAPTPAETTNPLLPTAAPGAGPAKSPSGAAHPGGAVARKGSSGGGFPWLIVGIALGALIIVAGVLFLLIKRRTPGNYLTNPAYQRPPVYYPHDQQQLPPGAFSGGPDYGRPPVYFDPRAPQQYDGFPPPGVGQPQPVFPQQGFPHPETGPTGTQAIGSGQSAQTPVPPRPPLALPSDATTVMNPVPPLPPSDASGAGDTSDTNGTGGFDDPLSRESPGYPGRKADGQDSER